MDIGVAATFFVGSILFSFGFIVIAMAVLLLNNIYSKFWKPIEWRILPDVTYHFIEPTNEVKEQNDVERKPKSNVSEKV